uniref:Uncharacterized protein n=1 Tax=Glossina brevipalpis TaxID=37001 RepID=A0A1A9VZ42_9MUSC
MGTTRFSVAPHSVYIGVYGGAQADIAQAIFNNKAPGCEMNGDTHYTVQQSEGYSPPYPEYALQWQTAKPTTVSFRVTLQNQRTELPADTDSRIQQAIIKTFTGQDDINAAATIGALIPAGRFYAGVAGVDPVRLNIAVIELSLDAQHWSSGVTLGIDQVPVTSETAIQAQYAASPALNAVIATFEQAVSLERFTDTFLTALWDIETAQTYGLDIWGKIVGVSRYLTVEDTPDYLGFDEAEITAIDGYPQPFDVSPFYAGLQPSSVVRLTDDAYRKLIRAKAFGNITDATLPSINRFLRILFTDRGKVYCTDGRDMTMNIVFEFPPTPSDLAILKTLAVMPVPSGVEVRFIIAPTPNLGFAADTYPMDEGTFY